MREIALVTAIAAGLSCAGCGGAGGESTAARVMDAPQNDKLINRVWMRTDTSDLPGRKLIFLTDGTLVQDSCWEPYRLSNWRRQSSNQLHWTEDTASVQAEVVSLTESELVLRLIVPAEPQEQHFRVAAAPYVCPDMKR